jgi:DNA-binding MarR family transcriptional regulator
VGTAIDRVKQRPKLRLIHVIQKQKEALELRKQGLIRSDDFVILFYLLDALDNQTGIALRKFQTIADKTGVCLTNVKAAIGRLESLGLIARRQRYSDITKRQLCNEYTLPDFAALTSETKSGAGGRHSDHRSGSRNGDHLYPDPSSNSYPDVRCNQKNDDQQTTHETKEDADWDYWTQWLTDVAKVAYRKQGFGWEIFPKEDIDRWRSKIGDESVLKALKQAQKIGLFGEILLDWMEKRVEFMTRKRR